MQQQSNSPQLQLEAALVLTTIASSDDDRTRLIIDQGALPRLVSLLSSPNDEVRDQVAWILGNIAGTSMEFRDSVLASGGLRALVTVGDVSYQTG